MDLKKFDGNKIFKSHFIFCDIVSYIKQEETSVLIILHVKGIKQLEAIFFFYKLIGLKELIHKKSKACQSVLILLVSSSVYQKILNIL